ncbi:uncharacterized protein LOC144918827 [Branchiostoma floridae x Branchiostoma belcheri]
MKIATVGLLWACVLIALVYLDEVSGRRFGGGGGFRGGGGYRGSSSRSSRTVRTYRYRSSSSGSSGSSGWSGRGYSQRPRFVPPLLLSSSRRRRSTANGFQREQCQRCTTSYIYQNRGYFMKGTFDSPGAHEVSICREGTAACNWGKCSINYLWANNTITAFPDGKGGEDPAVGYISAEVESVLICGTLQLAPKLQVTILAVAMATVMQMIGGT